MVEYKVLKITGYSELIAMIKVKRKFMNWKMQLEQLSENKTKTTEK